MKQENNGVTAIEFLKYFTRASLLTDELLACKSARQKAIKIGKFLAEWVGKPVTIESKGRTGTATLRAMEQRANKKAYFVEIRWDSSNDGEDSSEVPPTSQQQPVRQAPASKTTPVTTQPKSVASPAGKGDVGKATKTTPVVNNPPTKSRPRGPKHIGAPKECSTEPKDPKQRTVSPPKRGGNSEPWG